ncbi:MAG: AAA family ATPase [Azoarcus sp.]|jgi:hypothetical protein|nr:AAA family ATPase [Azoarcus sp.]
MSRAVSKVPLKYWRDALAEAGLYHPDIDPEDKPIEIAEVEGQWRVIDAKPDIGEWTKKRFEESKQGKGKEKSGEEPLKTIPLLLIPARLSGKVSHDAKRDAGSIYKGHAILCIPCLLDREGRLLPDKERRPWIPRKFLEPAEENLTIGLLEQHDKAMSGLPEAPDTLDDTFQFAADLFREVTGACLPLLQAWNPDDVPVFGMDDYDLVSGWHGLADDPAVIAFHLIKLYNNIAQSSESLPLLDRLRTINASDAKPPQDLTDSEKQYAHIVGHVSSAFPLSPTQRMAMVELHRLGEGKLLAVNGPPGTGKTALLHSVVAQLWVDAALRQADCPLIVVTSTNKKAVENVLDSFAKISATTHHVRWHPFDKGFGLFLASERAESRFPTCTRSNHPFGKYENHQAVEEAVKSYLLHASNEFEREIVSLKDAVNALHGRLRGLAKIIETLIAARFELFRATGQAPDSGAESVYLQRVEQLQASIQAEQALISRADESLAECKDETAVFARKVTLTVDEIDRAEQQWNIYLAHSPLWLELLCFFLPPLRRRLEARDRAFLISHPMLKELRRRDEAEPHFLALRRAVSADRDVRMKEIDTRRLSIEKERNEACKKINAFERERTKIETAFQRWREVLAGGYETMIDVSLIHLNDKLDVIVRSRMFCIADWYWSGRWLMEMRQRLQEGEEDTVGFKRLQAKYRRFAKLTPCLVSNLHMAPDFFTAWQGHDMPFWNLIDLLVVDEAGQVSPELGAPMFALAKRALVVGDIYQIEPVWNIGESCDRANAQESCLIPQADDSRYDDLAKDGYTAASGNLMRIANQGCAVRQYEDMRGLMLTEHRRCVPELIGYCNELIYKGRLNPLRESIDPTERILPALGYLKIESEDKKAGTSRNNDVEAAAIVRWLKDNRGQIEAHYTDQKTGKVTPFWELVGIVTPFSAQARAIERHLRRAMPDLLEKKETRLTVGTVHALQGSERPIVIFSPTYGASFDGAGFFNQKPNMLNVAVSRAKDSFLVMGNVQSKLFNARNMHFPSGLLAKYLFESGAELPENLPMPLGATQRTQPLTG